MKQNNNMGNLNKEILLIQIFKLNEKFNSALFIQDVVFKIWSGTNKAFVAEKYILYTSKFSIG